MKTLKHEEVYMGQYETYLDVIENLPAFVEVIYNKKTTSFFTWLLAA